MATDELRVVKWLSYDEARELPDALCGGAGGWVDGDDWEAYLDGESFGEEARAEAEAVRRAVLEHEIRCGGDRHQDYAVPVLSNGRAAKYSFRAWGDLLAAIWNEHDGGDRGYFDFYMDATRLPADADADRTGEFFANGMEATR